MKNQPSLTERAEYWKRHCEEQRRSGEAVAAYCRTHGLCKPTFYDWRRRFDKQQATKTTVAAQEPKTVRFAVIEQPIPQTASAQRTATTAAGITIQLSGGDRIELATNGEGAMAVNETALRAVIAILREERRV
jgi:hypothetical protein